MAKDNNAPTDTNKQVEIKQEQPQKSNAFFSCCGNALQAVEKKGEVILDGIKPVLNDLGQTFVDIGGQYFLAQIENGIVKLQKEALSFLPEHVQDKVEAAIKAAIQGIHESQEEKVKQHGHKHYNSYQDQQDTTSKFIYQALPPTKITTNYYNSYDDYITHKPYQSFIEYVPTEQQVHITGGNSEFSD